MTYKFPSDEWVNEYMHQLNTSPDYERAGKDWERDILFVSEPDRAHPEYAYFYLDLYHGKCREARLLSGPDEKKTGYIISTPFSTWRKIISGELDPIQALMTRKLKLQGDLMLLMRYPKAAMEMFACVKRVPTNFGDRQA